MFYKKYKEVVNPYNEENSSNYKGLMLKGELDDSVINLINKKNIESLYVSFVSDNPFDLSLLGQCKGLKEVDVITGSIKGCNVFHVMPGLEKIRISCEVKEELNFNNNLNLKCASFVWSKNISGILNCRTIESLFFSKLKKSSLSFEGLINLKFLDIRDSKIDDLFFIEKNINIESIRLDGNSIKNINCLQNLKNLKKLIIRFSPDLTDIKPLASLDGLEVLVLDSIGHISDSSPLHNLKNLKALSLGGKTCIKDGNLFFLENYKKLSMLSLSDCKNYSHKSIRSWNWDDLNKENLKLYERM